MSYSNEANEFKFQVCYAAASSNKVGVPSTYNASPFKRLKTNDWSPKRKTDCSEDTETESENSAKDATLKTSKSKAAKRIDTRKESRKINELMESHRSASQLYGKLSRKIRLELNLPLVNRTADGAEIVHDAQQEMDRLIEQSPPLPKKILVAFDKEFPEDNIFTKPEILHVHPILPFKAIKEYSILSLLKKPSAMTNLTDEFLKEELNELRGKVMPGSKQDIVSKSTQGISARRRNLAEPILRRRKTVAFEEVSEEDIEAGSQAAEDGEE